MIEGRKIRAVYGQEPMREGEYPDSYSIGVSGVTRIECREQNLGTYGILWFDVFIGDYVAASLNGIHISSVVYAQEDSHE